MLCIRGEILKDLPTPAQDQSLRWEHQMQRLVERMGRGGDAADDSIESLLLDWVRCGCESEEKYQELLARFRGVLRSRGA
jgi:hypothetical protein